MIILKLNYFFINLLGVFVEGIFNGLDLEGADPPYCPSKRLIVHQCKP